MKHFKTLISLLTLTAVAVTVPLAVGQFKKHSSSSGTFDAAKVKSMSKSPYTQPMPAKRNEPSQAGGLKMRGLVINSDTPYIGEFTIGESIAATNIYSMPDIDATGGAVFADGRFYINSLYEPSIGAQATMQYIYDASSWELLEEHEDMLPSSSAICMTYDPMDCAIYGYFQNDDQDSHWFMYGRMNVATGEVVGINNVDTDEAFMCIAASPDGNLYGVNVSGQYCRIKKKTGEITILGHTDVKPYYMQSATIDWNTGKFYWAAMTDTGKSSLYEIEPETYMARKIADFPQNQEITGLYIVESGSASLTAEAPEGLTLYFDKDNLIGTATFQAPRSTADGSALSGNLTAHVAVDGNHYEVPTAPGAECSLDIAVNYGGLYTVAAWISDDSGNGQKATVQKWIGPDYPTEAKNVRLSVTGNNFVLTWEAPSPTGKHGGYVDPQNTVYCIGSDGFRMHPVYDHKALRYEGTVPDKTNGDIRLYVRPVYKELTGPIVYSDKVFVGSTTLSVPVSISASSLDKFIVIDANNDGITWEKSFGFAQCDRGNTAPGDDWLLTPEITLTEGEVYELKYEASAKMGILNPQILEVKMGKGDTAGDMTIDIDSQTINGMSLSKFATYTATFTAPSDGDFRLGFHAASENSGTLSLSSITLKALAASSGPAKATSTMVKPAPGGSLSATIDFTAPTKDIEGGTLSADALSKIEVFRDSQLVGTVQNPVPGTKYSVTDDSAQQGINEYEIVATDKTGTEGLKATARGWVGIDIPSSPEDVVMVEKNGNLVITWNLPNIGTHGGYVNPDEVTYTVLLPSTMSEIASVKGLCKIEIPVGEITSQSVYCLGIIASNEAGTNPEGTLTPNIVVGPAYSLPFHERFNVKNLDYSWHLTGEALEENSGWMPVTDLGPDGQPGVSTFWGEWEEEQQSIITGKISLKGTSSPILRFYELGNLSDDAEGGYLTVGISESFNGNYITIHSKEFTEPGSTGWLPVEISLKDYVGKEVYISFTAKPEYGSIVVGIDDVSIREAIDYDASVEAMSIDKDEVEAGVSTATVKARIQNHGVKDLAAGTYKIGFYAGDRQFSLLDGLDMPGAWGQTLYETIYTPSVDDTDPAIITAKIESDFDENASNNVSKEAKIYVVKPERPVVTDLTGKEDPEGVALTWTKPDQSGLPVREVTDDFEAYRTFDVNRAGEWTIIDEDQLPGTRTSYFFPGSTGPMGWIVMEPAAIPRVGGGTNADRFPAFSGKKMMVAYNPGGDNKDWLITPELSGLAQTVSFMARAESPKQGREMFEVYYSTTLPTIEEMVRLDNVDYRTALEGWQEHSFNLPEGAKYFAVRCVSHNRMAMHIDDFRYESAPTPLKVQFVGYNVYRDGVRLNSEPLKTPYFLDTTVAEGESHSYTVRVVYDRGESAHSNGVTVLRTGIENIYSDGEDSPAYDLHGRRISNNGANNEIIVKRGKKEIRR